MGRVGYFFGRARLSAARRTLKSSPMTASPHSVGSAVFVLHDFLMLTPLDFISLSELADAEPE